MQAIKHSLVLRRFQLCEHAFRYTFRFRSFKNVALSQMTNDLRGSTSEKRSDAYFRTAGDVLKFESPPSRTCSVGSALPRCAQRCSPLQPGGQTTDASCASRRAALRVSCSSNVKLAEGLREELHMLKFTQDQKPCVHGSCLPGA